MFCLYHKRTFLGLTLTRLTSEILHSKFQTMILEDLIKADEGKCLEFKENIDSHKKILATIIAFANTAGGKLLIGVQDKTRYITGVEQPHLLEEAVSNMISDAISPQIVPNIEILNWQNRYVLMVEVFPGNDRPYFLKSKGEEKSSYVRVGSTNRIADKFMVESLRRTRNIKVFDEEIMYEASSEVIDFRLASELFEPVRSITEKSLITLGILAQERDKTYPTIGGLILFGVEKERYLPDAWIQAGAFKGVDKTYIFDSQKINTPFVKAVEEVMSFIRKHLNISLIMSGNIQHREAWSIPQTAIREAVVNAVVHADYSLSGSPIRVAIFDDRLEIDNPGLLPFGITLEQIKQGISKIRNRVIARVFQELGIIEQWGSGIQRIVYLLVRM